LQTILITGCSKGIGLQTALYLKQQGFNIYATVKNRSDIDQLKSLGLNTYYLDVTDIKSIQDTINTIISKEKSLDVVFNNAGFGQPGAIEDISTKILKEQFETNFFGLHSVTVEALKVMKAQGYGKIIQHSSVLGLVSLKFRGAYNASKYAIEGLTDTLRLELEDTNIQVTLLNTGPIISNFRNNAKEKLIKNVNINNSRFKDQYQKSLASKKSDVPFTLEAIDVAKVVEKIILSKTIKPRYYITKATYLLGFAKRILSTTMLDKILKNI
jgi:NAD(P)-dependent dehydrogenase (short-subunit alcohol dehydrogenase family)